MEVPLSRVSLGVFVVQAGALGLECCTAAEVLKKTGGDDIKNPELAACFIF